MNIVIKEMETDDEMRGKAFVHWKSWHETFSGLVAQDFLDALTLEKCTKMTYDKPDNFIVAKLEERVIGFVGYGDRGNEASDIGEIFWLYVLSEFHGKGVAQQLMDAGLERLNDYPQICVWALKENERAIRFYRRYGFTPDGEEFFSLELGTTEIRMVLAR